MSGCSKDDALLQDTQNEEPVAATLAFSVTTHTSAYTRMSSAVVQDAGQPYRGIEMRRIVPFAVEGKITKTDLPKLFQVVGEGEKPVNSRAYYYYNSCALMSGVASFLSYGRAPQISPANKAANGSIIETFPTDMAPKNIRFSLESISPKVANSVAISLANYMTAIANASANDVAWKDATNTTLKVMYLNFIKVTESQSSGELLPGSSENIKAYTNVLYNLLDNITLAGNDIAIRTAIKEKINAYSSEWDNFPASIGLPDGAAVIRWDGTKFVPEVSNTALADINGIDRIAYPAELYYYGNSRINTSNIDKRRESYTDREWAAVLADYEIPNGVISTNTAAVAIIEPLQYAVAQMRIRLLKTATVLEDAKGTNVVVGTDKFPLTGIIVGGQLPVAFDFTPTTAYPIYSEADMKYIYDSQIKIPGVYGDEYLYLSSIDNASTVTNTLVLQTYDNKKVPVVLEFINNSDNDFEGVDGIVYRGTKFYLVAEIDPETKSEDPNEEIRNRVFTQDYTTTLNMKVTGLAKAYNVVPNLLSPRLELGVELVTKWVSTTPEEVLF